MATRIRAPRSTWQQRRPVHPEPAAIERLRPAAEVLGTRCEPDGSVCGPYEQAYTVERGYTFDRSVIRP